jgi:hypothetical protein
MQTNAEETRIHILTWKRKKAMVVLIIATISTIWMIDATMMIGIHDGIAEMIATTTTTTVVLHHRHIIFIDVNQSHHPIMPEMLCLELSAE